MIIQNDCVECQLDESIHALVHRWLREPNDEEFKNGLLAILEEYNKLKPQYPDLKWLADTELLGELTEQVEEWLTTTWDQKLFDESGVKVHAVILGSHIFADYPMEVFKASSARKFNEMGVKLGVFPSREKAINWLKEN